MTMAPERVAGDRTEKAIVLVVSAMNALGSV